MKVGILGATGLVGGRFISLLQDHPEFLVTEVCASEKSQGKTYKEACRNIWGFAFSEDINSMEIKDWNSDLDCDLLFSALPGKEAGVIESDCAKRGYPVISNASSYRMESDVPLIIPEVNPQHLQLIETQKIHRNWDGFIVTNPNCTTIQLVLALKPLHDAFTVKKVAVASLQALSGAGYDGVSSLDIMDNVIPYIPGEEEKIQEETLKLLGNFKENSVVNADIQVSAQCNRVNVSDGHLECVYVAFDKKTDIDSLKDVLRSFSAEPQEMNLPSAPKHPIIIMDEQNRPQPRLDRNLENGMASIIGRIRTDPIFDYKFLVLGHNTVRGAAGGTILNAEFLCAKNYV
jgi:aspartate-semialdehyde dehydrogenase